MSRQVLWSSLVREPSFRDDLARRLDHRLQYNTTPVAGDLVLVRSLGGEGAYTELETADGRVATLHKGTMFVGVIGTRHSTTNPTCEVPAGPLRRGERLGLAAIAGIVGSVTFTPTYHGQALPVEVEGFIPGGRGGRCANLRDGQSLEPLGPQPLAIGAVTGRVVIVAGSSAESGKTTTVAALLRAARRGWPHLSPAVVKVNGTGRSVDVDRYRAAGACFVHDFVDAGYPTTYGVPGGEYDALVAHLVSLALRCGDIVIIEIGGDLLEECAIRTITAAARWEAPVVLLVNDGLGALAGLRLLRELGITDVAIATMRQNVFTLASRLGISTATDPLDARQIDELMAVLMRSCRPSSLEVRPS